VTRGGQGSTNRFMILVVGAPGENGDVGLINLYRVDGGLPLFLSGDYGLMQSSIQGDLQSGDRFGSTLLQPRAMVAQPFE
jgi:hypothetical protein